jgi:alpha-tubulin suppressor-like RCC1 family protein
MRTRLLVVGLAVGVAAAAGAGCRPSKPPTAKRLWLGPNGGCVTTPEHRTSGTFACWGVNDAGQVGDGTTQPRPSAMRMHFDAGEVTELALGEKHGCGLFDQRFVECWGDGSRGQLGSGVASSPKPVRVGEGFAVEVGGAFTCIESSSRDQLRCFGENAEGQLGADAWARGAGIRSFALGTAHTCVAYARSASESEMVLCRGRATAAPRDPVLGSVVVKELAAGGDHTCALIEDGTVRCWGTNDAGQLGDGTTQDSLSPVSVGDLHGVIQVALGLRHSCALLQNGTIACWGANEHHQLAIGTTENSTRPRVVVGLVGGKEIAAAGDGTCARLEGGYVRCWGKNDRSELGDGSSVEHTVPVQIRFR